MRKIFFILITMALMISSCCKYNKSDENNDLSMDFFGDGVYVNEVLVIEDRISLGTIARTGKTKDEIRDFLGFIMDKGILYIVIDTRDFEGGITAEMLDQVSLFKKEWAEGEYKMYNRFVYPIWMVYGGDNKEEMFELNGYYEGAGWYIYEAGTEHKFFTEVSSLSDVDIFDYIFEFTSRTTIHCDQY